MKTTSSTIQNHSTSCLFFWHSIQSAVLNPSNILESQNNLQVERLHAFPINKKESSKKASNKRFALKLTCIMEINKLTPHSESQRTQHASAILCECKNSHGNHNFFVPSTRINKQNSVI